MITAVDHFAGTGWGVALERLGIDEHGVELMNEAVATREMHGMRTSYRDVWEGLFDPSLVVDHDLYIASPPCQTFSTAGAGSGRKALEQVLDAVRAGAYRYPAALHLLGEHTDPRTALVLTPLAHIFRHRPELIALEQVPPVLPVWQAYAEVLRSLGYSVWVGVLSAEQYGVPQTRKRAILIARRDGITAAPPAPTHSRFYARDPHRLDAGVLPWMSMAAALGWGLSERPSPTITGGGTETGGAEPIAKLARYTERDDWVLRSNYSSGSPDGVAPEGNKLPRTERPVAHPSTTITSKAGSMKWVRPEGERPDWTFERPATTIVADPRLGGPGRSEFVKGGVSRQDRPGSLRLDVHEAAALQSYPQGFAFVGGKGRQFLQVGNAVPPLLAEAIIGDLTAHARAALAEPVGRVTPYASSSTPWWAA